VAARPEGAISSASVLFATCFSPHSHSRPITQLEASADERTMSSHERIPSP
jgi:hypothetical protein